jgi:hypothetical protein
MRLLGVWGGPLSRLSGTPSIVGSAWDQGLCGPPPRKNSGRPCEEKGEVPGARRGMGGSRQGKAPAEVEVCTSGPGHVRQGVPKHYRPTWHDVG